MLSMDAFHFAYYSFFLYDIVTIAIPTTSLHLRIHALTPRLIKPNNSLSI